MVEINNQRKAFLDMLAWSEGTDNGRQKTRNHGYDARHCRREAIYWSRSPSANLSTPKPKTQINRRRILQPFPLVGFSCLAWPERRLLSAEKSGRCGIAAD